MFNFLWASAVSTVNMSANTSKSEHAWITFRHKILRNW